MSLPKVSTSNNWVQTYQILREYILARKFGPNEKLSIPLLSEQLGVSPTPIRDAINRLESERLVRTVSKVGTFVTPIDGNNVLDLINSRKMIEHWVVSQWEEYSKDQRERTLSRLNQIVNASLELLAGGNVEVYLQMNYDSDFHLELVRLGGNKKNEEIYKSLMNYHFFNLGGSLVTLDKMTTSARQHEAILRALSSGDVSLMKTKISEHLDYSRDNLIDAIERNGGIL